MDSSKYEEFVKIVKEMFQLDKPDLDFGLFRIMHVRQAEIEKYLNEDLKKQVEEELSRHIADQKKQYENALISTKKAAEASGIDPKDSPKAKEIEQKLLDLDRKKGRDESDTYSHLITFFSRYYDKGDFISQRRYKDDAYAIPYEGEEVKLYWANHDQYYIKTAENFRNYAFRVSDGSRIHFKIIEADEEKDNRKASADKERRFMLTEENPVVEEGGELVIRLYYVSDPKKRKQEEINETTLEAVISAAPSAWKLRLTEPRPTEKEKNRSVLKKELDHYTAKNSYDYFIHKDLKKFLTRELDFYIKNEVVRLDDIADANAAIVEEYLSKVRVLRVVGGKIIGFLAQLENFQKKLWLKKKFITDAEYCITVDLIPEKYYAAVIENIAQKEEWKKLGFIDAKTKLTKQYLLDHSTLSIDTKFFPDIRDDILAGFDNVDDSVNGVLINSENFGALNVLSEKYREQVRCIYIDPPYNTDAVPIIINEQVGIVAPIFSK